MLERGLSGVHGFAWANDTDLGLTGKVTIWEGLRPSMGFSRQRRVSWAVGFKGCGCRLTDFWTDHGLALVGSPETVIRQWRAQYDRMGYDVFGANHRFGALPAEPLLKSLKLFG